MGVDATSAESALFSPRRSRPAERSRNRSWRTSSPARRVGSVALVFLPPESTAQSENCRTSERSSALGECSPICTGWRFFVQTERRLSAANKSGDDAISRESRVRFCFAGVDAIEWETQTSERTLRGRGISVASAMRLPPRTYPCRRATSDVREQAKRSRGSYGVAMSTFEERGRSGRKT